MISFNDYKKPNGDIDWAAHEAALVAAGEVCSQCGTYIIRLFGKPSGPTLCGSCKALIEDNDEVSSGSFVRCPACGNQMDACEPELYEDGSHDVTCDECDHEFEVETNISFSFTSPARLEAKPEPEEAKP